MQAFLPRHLLLTALLPGILVSHARAQELPQPGPEHRAMAREVGVWDAEVQMWLAPGAPAVKATGTETNAMLGGFWLVSDYQSEFAGQPFSGKAQMTYDAETQQYVSTWIDTMASTLLVSRGSYDVSTHTLTLVSGEHTCCMTGQRKRMKMVTRYVDDDHKHFEIYETLAGKEDWRKTMVADYTRRN